MVGLVPIFACLT